jgi:hypothetical protein
VQHDKTRWLDEALSQIPVDLKADVEGTTHREIADSYLRPLLKRCRATSRIRFWQWLRFQLAKSEETSRYLTWMRESKCPLEIKTTDGGFKYVVNGDVALVEVSSEADHAVWRLPASRLDWASSLYPVTLRRLPALESTEARQLRLLKRRVKREMPFLTPGQRQAFEREIEALEFSQSCAYEPTPRFTLVKYQDGRETPVHRLFLDAGRNDEVSAVDGDFLNFTTAKVRVTVEPVTVDGLTIAKGNRPPSAWSEELTVPNLCVVNSDQSQKEFEDSVLQAKTTAHGDIDTHLKIQPNASWRAGCHGQVVEAGKFEPLTPEEIVEHGMQEERPKNKLG